MDKVLCHIGNPRIAKPQSLQEYGQLREKMIQQPWEALHEYEFVRFVTQKGCPFYQALMNGRDLMEEQYEKLVWRTQTLVGLDFDVCDVSGNGMVDWFDWWGMKPWLAYYTFSNGSSPEGESYRLLWRVDIDLNLTYDECAKAMKAMRRMCNNKSDKHAANPTRMWQGTNSGFFHYDPQAIRLNLKELSK